LTPFGKFTARSLPVAAPVAGTCARIAVVITGSVFLPVIFTLGLVLLSFRLISCAFRIVCVFIELTIAFW
jgi:hypothetical protein